MTPQENLLASIRKLLAEQLHHPDCIHYRQDLYVKNYITNERITCTCGVKNIVDEVLEAMARVESLPSTTR